MSTDWYETAYALALEEGMSAEEAHLWAESQDGPRAHARRDPGGSGGLEVSETPIPSEPPFPPHPLRERFGLRTVIENASTRKDPVMIVDGLVPQGFTLLAGGSKLGKSYVTLDIAFAVASGSLAMGSLVTEPGDVLLLALEDRDDRLYRRMSELEPDMSAWPWDRLTMVNVNTIGDYHPAQLALDWASEVEKPTLVIIDTITRFGGQSAQDGYKQDVQWASRFHSFAQKNNVALIGVTHTRQSKLEEGEDWFHKITGTTGIVGTADQAMLLDVQRGSQEGVLRATGRDLPDAEFAVRRVGGFWQITDQLRGRRGDLSVSIGDYVIQMGTVETADVAKHFDISSDKASQYLGRLVRASVITKVKRGTWAAGVHAG